MDAIAEEDIAIVVVVVDKRHVHRRPSDPEDWYRQAVATACRHCAGRWAELELSVDRRYTSRKLRERLDDAIHEAIGRPATSPVRHVDSHGNPNLQVADFVAWTIRRKYEFGERDLYERIRAKIAVEEVVEAT